ncbi:MAG: FAD-dependent monooxygenase [Pseudomonadota bacterium]
MKAVVVGAGIGGLTAALALRRVGWEVELLERAEAVAEVGAGIQLSPNGTRVLSALGLGPAIEAVAYEPDRLEMRLGPSGFRVFSLPLGAEMRRRYGAPYLQVHRADLVDVLVAALAEAAPGAVRTGVAVTGYERGPKGAAALTAGGAVEGDAVIGADGLRSTIREAMLGAERPRFTGAVAWRAVVPREAAPADLPTGACVWAGPARHAVTYPLRRGELVNFVGIVEESGWETESWTEPGAPEALAAEFEGWAAPLAGLIAAIKAPFRWALHDRAPLPRWTDGPVALLGDACHPMLPSFAQGACQAVEDACALAGALGPLEDVAGVDKALARYAARRAPRTSRVQAAALGNLRLFHRRGRLAQALTYGPAFAAGLAAPAILRRRYDWVYAHDETAAAA